MWTLCSETVRILLLSGLTSAELIGSELLMGSPIHLWEATSPTYARPLSPTATRRDPSGLSRQEVSSTPWTAGARVGCDVSRLINSPVRAEIIALPPRNWGGSEVRLIGSKAGNRV